jgi:hypothetical protein
MTGAVEILRPARTGPVARCPACDGPLDGGPVSYYCPVCQRGVMAADARTGGVS